MTDLAAEPLTEAPGAAKIAPGFHMSARAAARTKARYAAERRFRALGLAAVVFSLLALAVLLVTILKEASPLSGRHTFSSRYRSPPSTSRRRAPPIRRP